MSARASAVKLTKCTKQFLQSWDQVRNYWRDQKSRDFEKKYIGSLRDDVGTAAKVIEEIDKVLTKARRDCEE